VAFRAVRSALRFRGSDDLRGSGVTGRWPFPFPPRPCLLPGGPSGSSARSATLGSTRASCPLASGSPPELLSRADRLSPVSSPGIRRDERSRDSSPVPPLHRHGLDASTPTRCRHRASDPSGQLGFLFRPRGFSPPRRFPPRRNVRACCIPLPILGFTAFPAFDRHLLPKLPWSSGAFPAMLPPLEELPRP
jgi:hypothetical protein